MKTLTTVYAQIPFEEMKTICVKMVYSKVEYFERRKCGQVLRPRVEVMPEEIIITKLMFGDVYEGEAGTT